MPGKNKIGLWVFRGLVFAAMLACQIPAHADTLRLTSGVGAPYFLPNQQGFLDQLIPEVFRRIGVAAVAEHYSASARANINANEAVDDGVAMRVRGLEKNFPNLLRIEEKIIDNEFVAYSITANFATTSFAALRPYQVAYITGWKVFDDGILPDTAVTRTQDAEQLFALLANGRTDVVLFERWQGSYFVRERKLPVRMLEPPLVRTEMFMYLHKKHAHLVGPAAKALQAMKADGSYQRIYAQTLERKKEQ